MTRPAYHMTTCDVWAKYDVVRSMVWLESPELGWKIAMPHNKFLNGEPLNALVPMFKSNNPDKNSNVLCSTGVMELLRWASEEPDLLAKIVAVTEAHIALKG